MIPCEGSLKLASRVDLYFERVLYQASSLVPIHSVVHRSPTLTGLHRLHLFSEFALAMVSAKNFVVCESFAEVRLDLKGVVSEGFP